MIYLSYLQRTPVADLDGEKIGRLEDVIAAKRGDLLHPVLVAIVVRCPRKQLIVPLTNITALAAPIILLNRVLSEISPYEPGERDLYLVRDVLDKQIIDTDGMRVVRVNDLELARVNGNYYIANADIGILGLLRRTGMAKSFQKIANRLHLSIPSDLIAWHHIDLLPDSRSMRLKVSSDRLSELHPADLAEILSDLSSGESSMILETLEVEKLADTLEEVEPEFQASLVKSMPDEKVADVLEEMAPDEAADLLAQLPEDRSHDLLELMEEDEAEEVRNLLKYPEDSAGGIMNTEYVAIRPDLTAEQAIAALRESADKAETFFYIYVTDAENQLAGVFSLQDLVLAQPNTPVNTFMHKKLVSIDVTCGQEEVAQMVTKYNLLAIPVVDEQHKLLGIVTADDALDKIIPTAWKKRLPRMYR